MIKAIVSIRNNIAKFARCISSKKGYKSCRKKWIQLAREKCGEIKYKLNHLYETNILLGLKHYYDGNMFDAILRFRLVLMFRKNDEQALQNMILCLYRKNDQQKLAKLLDKIAELYSENEILLYIKQKMENIDQIKNLSVTLYNNYFSYNVFLQKQIPIIDRRNVFLWNVLMKYFSPNDSVRFLDINCNCGENGVTTVDFFKECYVIGVEISPQVLQICRPLQINNRDVYNEIVEKQYDNWLDCSDSRENFHLIAINFHFHFHSDFVNILQKTANLMDENTLLYFKIQNTQEKQFMLDKDLDLFCYSHRFVCDSLVKNGFAILEVQHRYEKNEDNKSAVNKLVSSEFLVKKIN